MGLPTGQMDELTQEKLDDYNTLYCWEYNDMCDFIENHSEEEFVDHYETYNRLVDEYGQNLVDEFIEKTGWEITSYPDSKMISINVTGLLWVAQLMNFHIKKIVKE